MRSKSTKPTSDELLAQFDNLGIETTTTDEPSPKPTTPIRSEQDLLDELDSLASQRPLSTEPRPSTRSPKPATPSTTAQSTEEKAAPVRKSEESGRSSATGNKTGNAQPQPSSVSEERATTTAEETAQAAAAAAAGGGWWGGLFATASAAMKQAEAAVKEIQKNEEAQKWAQQVKGNVGALKELGTLFSFSSFGISPF